jgi:hypothetical protein
VLARHLAHSWIADGAPKIPEVDIAPPVTFLGQRQNGIWSDMDLAVETSSEVHSEEREARVWNGIHETVNELCSVCRDLVIFAPEWDDLRV